MNDDHKKSKKHAESDDSEADDNENDTKKSQTLSENDMFGFMGLIAKSDGKVSAHAGTSNTSNKSFQMSKIEEDIIPSESGDNISEGERKRERRAKRKVEIKEEATINEELGAASGTAQQNVGGASLRSFGSEINQLNDRVSSDYELDDLNFNLGTMTIEQDHESGDESQSMNEKHKLKRTVMTILLTQRWRKSWKRSNKRKGKGGKKIVYLPTYRLDPKQNINLIKHIIVNRVKNTFESLIDKHKQYDIEYTPRFLRILAEMIKNDAKTYKLERYKIISHVSILQKKLGQSFQFISRLLGNHDYDQSICLRYDTKSFYATCLLFFIYHE